MKTYEVKYQEDGKIKTISLTSENIKNENLPNNVLAIVETKNQKNTSIKKNFFSKKVKYSEVLALFNELNIMLQANILLNDAVTILYENTKNTKLKEILACMLNALQNGQQLNVQLEPYRDILGDLPLVFLKIAQENGNLKTVMSSLVMVLKNKQESKEAIFSSLRYPLVLTAMLLSLILFSFYFVIPRFENLFLQYESNLPLATAMLLNFKDFIHKYLLYIVFFTIGSFIFLKAKYIKNLEFKEQCDKFIAAKIPLLSKVFFYNNFHIFFLSVSILLDDKYRFQTAFINSQILLGNSFILKKLKAINKQIQSGKSISFAFENSRLFDDLILRLISVGEQSNSLHITIKEIEKIYKKRVQTAFKNFVFYIEPLFLILISLFVVWLMLAIFLPIWNLNEAMSM